MKKQIFVVMFVVPVLLFSCKNAAKELEKKGIEFSERSFLEQVESGDTETVKLFIEGKVDVNATNEKGKTALMVASIYGFTGIGETLINAGADLNSQDNNGLTALHHSIVNGTVLFNILVSSGADLYKKDWEGDSLLHYTARFKRKNMFDRLITENVPIDTPNKEGFTPLSMSLYSREYEMAKTLIKKGADLNFENSGGVTPFMLAVSAGRNSQPEIVKLMIEKGADIHKVDSEGKTALFYAVGKIWIDVTEILLEAGADPKVVDKKGRTVLDLLTGEGEKESREVIRKIINAKLTFSSQNINLKQLG
jgi:uncharacterized protein